MNKTLTLALSLVAAAVLAACGTVPMDNAQLDIARRDVRAVQEQPQARELAGNEIQVAADALARANAAQSGDAGMATIDHLSYLAIQSAGVAQAVIERKRAEAAVAGAEAARDKVRLAARTLEADSANRSALDANRQADASARQADASARVADAAQRDAMAAQAATEAARRQAAGAQQNMADAQARNAALEAQLKELNAKKTERGMVVTIGDVLFDTGRSELKSGGMRSIEQLGNFLKQYPQRTALIEGFTDSVGSDSSNQTLSTARAAAVRSALLGMGLGSERISARGYGEAFPVAGNDSAGGRQMNRRVEIVLSDDGGKITPR